MIVETARLNRAGAVPKGWGKWLSRVWPALRRYSLSTGGPIATSAAHFVASLILLRNLPPADFGLFSFLLIVAPFCLSLAGALVGAPFIAGLRRTGSIEDGALATHLKANLVYAAASYAIVGAAMAASGAGVLTALILGLYGAAMTLRVFGRTYAYSSGRPRRALASDVAYSVMLVGGLVALLLLGALTMERAAAVLAGASIFCFPAFGRDYLVRQLRPGGQGSLVAYIPHWHEFARWAALGVVLTEFTANAHAYIVTFVAGPKAFAVLALGSLVMRPASLVLSSLPDIERPRIARKIGSGDMSGAFRVVKDFRTAAAIIWLATLALAAVVLMWFPHILLKKGYDADQALIVIAIWGVILAVRTLRTPESVLLQAAGEFRDLAGASLWSSITSVAMTLSLLLAIGPIAALSGILAGDLVMTVKIFALARRWRRAHG